MAKTLGSIELLLIVGDGPVEVFSHIGRGHFILVRIADEYGDGHLVNPPAGIDVFKGKVELVTGIEVTCPPHIGQGNSLVFFYFFEFLIQHVIRICQGGFQDQGVDFESFLPAAMAALAPP